jgi:hypothetical protein
VQVLLAENNYLFVPRLRAVQSPHADGEHRICCGAARCRPLAAATQSMVPAQMIVCFAKVCCT